MRIGIVADTHIPGVARELPPQVAWAFEGVDLILHTGDIFVTSCLDWLEGIAPVLAVEWIGSAQFDGDPRVAGMRVLSLDGHSIGMIHDLMMPGMWDEVWPGTIAARYPPGDSLSASLSKVFGSVVDIVAFGHTHRALVEEHQGILFVNPGSPTLPRQVRQLGTVAILDLTPEGRKARIVDLSGLGPASGSR